MAEYLAIVKHSGDRYYLWDSEKQTGWWREMGIDHRHIYKGIDEGFRTNKSSWASFPHDDAGSSAVLPLVPYLNLGKLP